jgi:primary-amine oxidase
MMSKHPLEQLSREEIYTARHAILKAHQTAIYFRSISAVEPPKAQLVALLDAEHAGTLPTGTGRPPRQARVQYDVVHRDGGHDYMESVIDIVSGKEVHRNEFDHASRPSITQEEFQCFTRLCKESDVFKQAVNALKLDDKFEVAIDAWPYGGPDADEIAPRCILSFLVSLSKDYTENTDHIAGTFKASVLQS